jgi:hypothetical protein
MLLSIQPLTIRAIFAAAIVVAMMPLAEGSPAAQPELKVQEQWAYTRHVDQATGRVQFSATNMAMEDENAWLVLACDDEGKIRISIVHKDGFHYLFSRLVSNGWCARNYGASRLAGDGPDFNRSKSKQRIAVVSGGCPTTVRLSHGYRVQNSWVCVVIRTE